MAVSVPLSVCGVGSVGYSAGGGSRPRGGGGPAPGSGALQQPRPRPRPRPGHVVVAAARAPRHRVGHLHRGGVILGQQGRSHLGEAPLGAVVGGGHVVGGGPLLGAAYTRVPTSPAAVS